MDRHTLAERLEALDRRPALAEYQSLARALDGVDDGRRPVRVALLASFTVEPLLPFLRVEAARLGFKADVYIGPFNETGHQLLDPDSGFARHRPELVFVTQLLADVCPQLIEDFLAIAPDDVDALIEETVGACLSPVAEFVQRTGAIVVVGNFIVPSAPLLGIHEPMADHSQTSSIRRLNARLAEAARSIPGVYVQDLDRLAAGVGRSRWDDSKMWWLARAPLSSHALPVLASSHASFISAALAPPRKVLALDLDGTLWGGTLGEDGIGGIKLGHTYPGNAFRQFQRELLSLHRRGILLAVVSKNNPDEVAEVFRSHPDMVLGAEHFSAVRVNWRDKPENLAQIAEELNVGLESIVFFDDNPAECALMRRMLPDVLTIKAPPDVLEYPAALVRSRAFERLSLTSEDRRRGDMYRNQALRQQELQRASSLSDFLCSLEMEAEIRPVDQFTLPRAVELTTKTNQFNLTTRRYTAAEMAEAVSGPDRAGFTLRLSDRLGDNGVVGLALLSVTGDAAVLDAFLLSCRVIGRGAETALLSFLVEWARGKGLAVLEGEFIPTRKNAPAADFFRSHGFVQMAATGTGTRWRLSTREAEVLWPPAIRTAPLPVSADVS